MSRLRNITVTLEEDLARWVRLEAAKRETSVSRLLGKLLKQRMADEDGYERAMRRALERRAFVRSSGGGYFSRDEAHDRTGLR
jgi:hypothetical protein